MSENNFLDQVLDERKFLHDLSNKLLVAQGMSAFVARSLKNGQAPTEKDLSRCEKLLDSVSEMTKMLQERRAHLHSLSE